MFTKESPWGERFTANCGGQLSATGGEWPMELSFIQHRPTVHIPLATGYVGYTGTRIYPRGNKKKRCDLLGASNVGNVG